MKTTVCGQIKINKIKRMRTRSVDNEGNRTCSQRGSTCLGTVWTSLWESLTDREGDNEWIRVQTGQWGSGCLINKTSRIIYFLKLWICFDGDTRMGCVAYSFPWTGTFVSNFNLFCQFLKSESSFFSTYRQQENEWLTIETKIKRIIKKIALRIYNRNRNAFILSTILIIYVKWHFHTWGLHGYRAIHCILMDVGWHMMIWWRYS